MQTPQVAWDLDHLNLLNETELSQLIRRQTGVIVARSIGKDRMIGILESVYRDGYGGMMTNEYSKTNESRQKLQLFIEKNWNGIQSQLPCKGENRGRCTIYPCSEGRHVDCLLAAGPHMKVHDI